ncbi:AAA family ATPase [Ornithinibacillus sp. L9]|uniref:AAA family ATPase n=1 Tax=Ornithinibacillus caprae TaxID=2678566 RepID=A0A6N8FPW6_9BACI|nr:kinase [Ornithinibacillus caprae]MUK90754.1 AAA family ATPase [Ornithinibacillus caprae]
MENKTLHVANDILMFKKGEGYVVGIDGLSRSGKTTFVTQLKKELEAKELQVFVFHIDDYIVEKSRRYHTSYDEWYEYYYLQWDVHQLENDLFCNLKLSTELQLSTYDQHNDTHKQELIKLPKSCVLIIEGVFLQRKEWRDYFDYVIYLDCPREQRFIRESKETQRDLEKFRNRYWKAEDHYLETEDPMKQANLVFRM